MPSALFRRDHQSLPSPSGGAVSSAYASLPQELYPNRRKAALTSRPMRRDCYSFIHRWLSVIWQRTVRKRSQPSSLNDSLGCPVSIAKISVFGTARWRQLLTPPCKRQRFWPCMANRTRCTRARLPRRRGLFANFCPRTECVGRRYRWLFPPRSLHHLHESNPLDQASQLIRLRLVL